MIDTPSSMSTEHESFPSTTSPKDLEMNDTPILNQEQSLNYYKANPQLLKPHYAATLQPSMTTEELLSLESDIAANGLREPIEVIWFEDDWTVLDGRHRLQAAIKVGAEVKLKVVETEDPTGYVIGKHLRRNLTSGQRAVIGHRLVGTGWGGNRVSRGQKTSCSLTLEQAAAKVGANTSYVKKVARIERELGPDYVERIFNGENTLAEIYKQVPKAAPKSKPAPVTPPTAASTASMTAAMPNPSPTSPATNSAPVTNTGITPSPFPDKQSTPSSVPTTMAVSDKTPTIKEDDIEDQDGAEPTPKSEDEATATESSLAQPAQDDESPSPSTILDQVEDFEPVEDLETEAQPDLENVVPFPTAPGKSTVEVLVDALNNLDPNELKAMSPIDIKQLMSHVGQRVISSLQTDYSDKEEGKVFDEALRESMDTCREWWGRLDKQRTDYLTRRYAKDMNKPYSEKLVKELGLPPSFLTAPNKAIRKAKTKI